MTRGQARRHRLRRDAKLLELRSYLPNDLAGVEAVLYAAFESAVAPAEVIRLSSEPHHIGVALEDRVVVGLAASTRYGSAAHIGPTAVHPERQNHGIGGALLLELISRLEGEGVTSMALEASEAGIRLYEQQGFMKTDMTKVYQRRVVPSSESVASIAGAQSVDFTSESEPAMSVALRLDAVAYDYDRGTLLRQFAATKQKPKILISNTGYAFARETILGPWVATNPVDAATLLLQALAERPSIERIFAPQSNAHAVRLVSAAGFIESRASSHMTRGPE